MCTITLPLRVITDMKETEKKSNVVKKLRSLIDTIPEVDFAYLFGSFAKDRITPLSDIDVAVHLQDKIKSNWRFRVKLLGKISDELQSDRVDLIILNDSSILLSSEILKHGLLLHCRNPGKRLYFFQKTVKLYCDMAQFREFHINAASLRAKQGVKRGSSRSFADSLERVRRLFG